MAVGLVLHHLDRSVGMWNCSWALRVGHDWERAFAEGLEVVWVVVWICSLHQSIGRSHDRTVAVEVVGGTLCSPVRCVRLAEADLISVPGSPVAVVFEEVFSGYLWDCHRDCCFVLVEQKDVRVMAIDHPRLLRHMHCHRTDSRWVLLHVVAHIVMVAVALAASRLEVHHQHDQVSSVAAVPAVDWKEGSCLAVAVGQAGKTYRCSVCHKGHLCRDVVGNSSSHVKSMISKLHKRVYR